MTDAGGPKVIIADSDRTVLELLQIRLTVAGFQPIVARTGPQALEAARTWRPVAMILDAGLPDMSGLDVLRALAKGGARPCPTLLIGRKLSSDDIRSALSLGARDCMIKPFSGADVLERLGRILRDPDDVVAAHIVEANCLDQKDLQTQYPHEASEHRRVLFARGSGMCPTWKNFRQFLADLGPAPDTDYLATRVSAGDLTYAAGKVAWIHRDRQPSLEDRWSAIELKPPAAGERWTLVRGKPVEYAALASHLGVPVEAMTVALRDKPCADDIVQHAAIGETLSQGEMSWLAPERQDSFFMGYRMWHMQVQPRFAAAATPAFLYIFIALPGMIKSRDELIQLDLWNPATDKGRREREQHPLWKRFGDAMVRVEAARAEFVIYKQYSLMTELDDLWIRVKQAEERFRKNPLSQAQQAA